ncbi:MAG TPA: hypothetical protein VG963_00680, partial [Polyangiaceae bacterium]|nr:hypothetical protein [Polyangiaceae bacterium]
VAENQSPERQAAESQSPEAGAADKLAVDSTAKPGNPTPEPALERDAPKKKRGSFFRRSS